MDVIKYACETDNIADARYELSLKVDNITSVEVIFENNQILFNVNVENVYDGDDLEYFHNFFIKAIVSISFSCGVPIENIRYCAHSLSTPEGSRNTKINAGPIRFNLPREQVLLTEQEINYALDFSSGLSDEFFMFVRQYSFANSEKGAISRFSFLYNIILQLAGDRQAAVDRLILGIDPSTPQSISPNNGKDETVYTKLRNELAHNRPNTTYSNTKNEIINRVDGFSEIVKSCIQSRLSR